LKERGRGREEKHVFNNFSIDSDSINVFSGEGSCTKRVKAFI
jgi:hypothetical protein